MYRGAPMLGAPILMSSWVIFLIICSALPYLFFFFILMGFILFYFFISWRLITLHFPISCNIFYCKIYYKIYSIWYENDYSSFFWFPFSFYKNIYLF